MFTVRETAGLTSFLVGAAVLAAVNPFSSHGRRAERERSAVQAAADHLTYDQITDAWMQARLGATAPLTAITEAVGVHYLSTSQENGAIILTFAGRPGRCVDLFSRPGGNSVATRVC